MRTLRKWASVSLATLFAWLMAGVASAQTTATSTALTPGVPSTGGADIAANSIVLLVSAAIILAAVVYLARKPAA